MAKKLEYSFNCNTEDSNVDYNQCEDTDCYREDNPYKLMYLPGSSFVRFKFENPANDKGYFVTSAKFKVNHCGTTSDGIVDIHVNEYRTHRAYPPPRWDFGWDEIALPIAKLHPGSNEIKVTLNNRSDGVCWYSDAIIELETGIYIYTLIIHIAACTSHYIFLEVGHGLQGTSSSPQKHNVSSKISDTDKLFLSTAKLGDNVLGSVHPLCLSPLSRLNRLTYDLDFWYVG